MVIPLVAGLVVDNLLRTGPLFFFVGLLIGVVAGIAVVITRIRQYL